MAGRRHGHDGRGGHDGPDPLAGQTFDGLSGSPLAGMPEPPPLPGEGGRRGLTAGLGVSVVVLLVTLLLIVL